MHASFDLQTVYVSIGEVCVGPLPDLSHDIEGQLCIIDQKTLVIRDFGYDGSGPGKSVNDFYNVQMYEASRSPFYIVLQCGRRAHELLLPIYFPTFL